MSEFSMGLQEFAAETALLHFIRIDDERIKELVNKLIGLSHNVKARLFYYANLCVQMESFFSSQKSNFVSHLSKVAKKMDESSMNDYEKMFSQSQYVEQQWLFYERLEVQESAIAVGIFLKSYTLLERVLNQICEIYKQLKNSNISYKDLEGGGIVRASKYIKQTVNINNESKNEWKLLRCWNTVRNQVMHEDALLSSDPKLIRAMRELGLKSIKDTTVSESEIINIKIDHVKSFLVLIDKNLSYFVLNEKEWK
ncbi:hypothetical protein NG54_03285 [Heyndrickxia ginsengihumi]|uniref:RiboL-PSP-HEPN domain-containing protein n=1 Tax=Heyndrickxia ginsengihumi TaxID=363870 RepID=A0A0A6VIA7_9BACI|nr:hypothetical protein [Heyndrickxia ginsengihumi]KHD86354.1 hypothetical protein NG54_03285 [Heyndrickxia ginsengihumi]